MRKYTALATSLVALAAAPAFAGGYVAPVVDVEPVVAVTPAPIVGTWTGGYLGANVNYGKAKFDDFTPDEGLTRTFPEPDGANFALRGGYDWQHGNGVFGLGAEYNLAKYKDDFALTSTTNGEVQLKNVGTVFLRAGYAFNDQLLGYGLLGYTHAKLDGDGPTGSVDGPTLGLGAEYRFNPNWSGYAEYAYTDFGSVSMDDEISTDLDLNQVKLGVNFRF